MALGRKVKRSKKTRRWMEAEGFILLYEMIITTPYLRL